MYRYLEKDWLGQIAPMLTMFTSIYSTMTIVVADGVPRPPLQR